MFDHPIPCSTTMDPPSTAIIQSPFLRNLRELLADNDCPHIYWNPSGKGLSFHRVRLEEFLRSPSCPLDETTMEELICQLNDHGFIASTAEPPAGHIDDDDEEEDTYLAFHNDLFAKQLPPVVKVPSQQQQQQPEDAPVVLVDLEGHAEATAKHSGGLYCPSEQNYLKYKRCNDPCYRLMESTGDQALNVHQQARDRFRAVLSEHKLRKIIADRLQSYQNAGVDIFHDLLPNETNISIQMGAIAGYYGETVVEEDLIQFFGKFLPMYKPISDVVDSITPSMNNKIQASSLMWRGRGTAASSSDATGQPTTIVTSNSVAAAGKRGQTLPRPRDVEVVAAAKTSQPLPLEACNDITFEYVSFKDQPSTSGAPKSHAAPATKTTTVKHAYNPLDEAVPIGGPSRNAAAQHHASINGGAQRTTNEDFILPEQMGEFSENLLESNYYDSTIAEFGLELKKAIDLIMN